MKIEIPFLKSKQRALSSKTIALITKKGDGESNVIPLPKAEAKTLKEKMDDFLSAVSFLGSKAFISIFTVVYILFVEGCIFINGYKHGFMVMVKTTAGVNVVLSGIVLFAMLPSIIDGKKLSIKDKSLEFLVTVSGLSLVFLFSLLSLLGMFDGGGSAP